MPPFPLNPSHRLFFSTRPLASSFDALVSSQFSILRLANRSRRQSFTTYLFEDLIIGYHKASLATLFLTDAQSLFYPLFPHQSHPELGPEAPGTTAGPFILLKFEETSPLLPGFDYESPRSYQLPSQTHPPKPHHLILLNSRDITPMSIYTCVEPLSSPWRLKADMAVKSYARMTLETPFLE